MYLLLLHIYNPIQGYQASNKMWEMRVSIAGVVFFVSSAGVHWRI